MVKQTRLEYQRTYREENRELRRKWNRDWIANNRERYNAAKYKYREKCKIEVVSFYSDGSMQCAICGYNDMDALVIDHINDNGAEHRKELNISSRGGAGMNTYEVLRKHGYPSGLQVLCANCNTKKQAIKLRDERFKNPHYTQHPQWK